MQKLSIQGGVALSGEVRVAGAKNAALPILAASLLTGEAMRITNLPQLNDVRTMVKLLEQMGVKARAGEHEAELRADAVTEPFAPYDLVKTMRASILVLGPLLTRFGEARVSLPGGCAIGKRLKGARIFMDTVTVTGTENLMMAACLAEGETVLENCAREPEVVDLARCLVAMGARIQGHGGDVISVQGVQRLKGVDYAVMPDRIEAGTFLAAAAATRGCITLTDAPVASLDPILQKLREAGAQITVGETTVRIAMRARPKAVSLRTAPHPGFPTDMQAQFIAMNCVASAPTSRSRATPR